jgi:hypothetical protein
MTEPQFMAKGTIKKAEVEYNNLHSFAMRYGYQIGQCKNLITLFKKLDITVEKLVAFNEQRTSVTNTTISLIEIGLLCFEKSHFRTNNDGAM